MCYDGACGDSQPTGVYPPARGISTVRVVPRRTHRPACCVIGGMSDAFLPDRQHKTFSMNEGSGQSVRKPFVRAPNVCANVYGGGGEPPTGRGRNARNAGLGLGIRGAGLALEAGEHAPGSPLESRKGHRRMPPLGAPDGCHCEQDRQKRDTPTWRRPLFDLRRGW